MNKEKFIELYKIELLKMYDWAKDEKKLERFLENVKITISTNTAPWNHTGAAVNAAWKSMGGKGKPTLKALRALA